MRIVSNIHSSESRLLHFTPNVNFMDVPEPEEVPHKSESRENPHKPESQPETLEDSDLDLQEETDKRVQEADRDASRERDRAGDPGAGGPSGASVPEVGIANVNIAAASAHAENTVHIDNRPQININVASPTSPSAKVERREVDDMALLQRLHQEYNAAFTGANPRNAMKIKMNQLARINGELEKSGSTWRVSSGPKFSIVPYQTETAQRWQKLPVKQQKLVLNKVQQYIFTVGRGANPTTTLSKINRSLVLQGVQDVHLEMRGTFSVPFIVPGEPPRYRDPFLASR
ncbi:MAG: hypothetical protein ABIG34_04310 [Candidatus Peregrinibacteria bacterium]